MPNTKIGSEAEELTQPQEPETAEVAQPQGEITADDINSMTSDEFAKYMAELDNGSAGTDVSVQTPEESPKGGTEEAAEGAGAAEEAEASHAASLGASTSVGEPYRTFATEEEYNTDRQNAIDEAFKKRFRSNREQDELNKANADKLSRIERAVRGNYGESVGDNWADMLVNQLDEAAAQNRNIPVTEYQQQQKDSADLARYRAQEQQAQEQQTEQNRIIERWKAEGEELKKFVPTFDFKTASQNDAFRDVIIKGGSVAQAYLAGMNSHPSQGKSESAATSVRAGTNALQAAARPKRREISQNAQMAGKGTGESTVNPSTLSSEDFRKYIESRKNM